MEDPRPSTSREETSLVLRDYGHVSPPSFSTEVDRSAALQPANIEGAANNVTVFAKDSKVHVGNVNDVHYNFLLNVGVGEGQGVSAIVEQCVEQATRDFRFAQSPWNGSYAIKGIRDISGRWYYWVIVLVVFSCVGSIAAAVYFTVNTLWMPTEQDVTDLLAALRRTCWSLVVPLVTLSCMNLVSTLLLSLSRAAGTQPILVVDSSPDRTSTNEDRDLVEHLPGGLQLMRRSFWRARPPCEVLDDNLLPIPTVVVCHTATRSPCDADEIARIINGFQRYHMEERFLDDISYNFLVGADGRVYEGRGWTKVSGHARGRGRGVLAVAIIGNFVNQLPPETQLNALFRFLDCGVWLGHLADGYRLLAHCQVVSTMSPGRALLDTMLTWPRFDRSAPLDCSSN